MLRAFNVPLTWPQIFKRTGGEVMADDCLGLAAQLAYYFFLALFPALLFLVAVIGFIPVSGLLDAITAMLARVAPAEVLSLVQEQILKIANDKSGGLLTLGMLGTIWSCSSGMTAIVGTMNKAYDIEESRPWWRVRLMAIGLTIALAIFIVGSLTLVLVGPTLAEHVAARAHLGPAFTWTWTILQWPVVFALVTLAIGMIYYVAPDAEQEWVYISPGAVVATVLWLSISLAFKFYVAHFASYTATYGMIGGVIVLMLWFYVSAFAVLVGAELNAEIEHASPHGKDPGEKVPGEKRKIGALAERAWHERRVAGAIKPALGPEKRDVDAARRPAPPGAPRPPRFTDWVVTGVVLGETALFAYQKLRGRFSKVRG